MTYNWHQKHKAELSLGDKAADKMRNGMGSWRFVFGFLIFMLLWAAVNIYVLTTRAFDPYPFILLNLLLSTLAGLQGAILLIAAKRQDAIASEMAEHDYKTNIKAEEEIRLLINATKEIDKRNSAQDKQLDRVLKNQAKIMKVLGLS